METTISLRQSDDGDYLAKVQGYMCGPNYVGPMRLQETFIDYAWEEISLLHANNKVCNIESHAVTTRGTSFRVELIPMVVREKNQN